MSEPENHAGGVVGDAVGEETEAEITAENEGFGAAWAVEGDDGSEYGLGDTVVRMPKIIDEVLTEAPPADPVEMLPPPAATLPPVAAAIPAAAQSEVMADTARPRKPHPLTKRPRKARLRVSRIDPWSVMKTSFLFSIAFGIMMWVAVWLLWTVIVQSGLFQVINESVLSIIQNPSNTETWRIEDYLNTNKVLGMTALIAVVNVVISTALGTVFAFLYNLSANVLGGLELTLAED